MPTPSSSMGTPTTFPPVYLLEIMSESGDVDECDNFAKLELAVESAIGSLPQQGVEVEVEVSFDDDHQLAGIGFLNEDHKMLACISVYHLDRDTDNAKNPAVATACQGDMRALQAVLNRLVRS